MDPQHWLEGPSLYENGGTGTVDDRNFVHDEHELKIIKGMLGKHFTKKQCFGSVPVFI
jgi:hypothetical protein